MSAELLVIAVSTFAVVATLQARRGGQTVGEEGRGRRGSRSSFAARPVSAPRILLAVAGISLAAEGGGGLYWWPAAIVVAFAGALTNSWVLLIEILR